LRWAGLRRGEAIALQRQDFWIDRAEGSAWLAVARQRPLPNSFDHLPTKGRRARTLAVADPLRPVLEWICAQPPAVVKVGRGVQSQIESPYLFPYRGDYLQKLVALLAFVEPGCFGAEGAAWHLFRHTCADTLKKAGGTDEQISKFLGHADTETTKVYLSRFVGGRVGAELVQKAFGFGPLNIVRGGA
jgi:integrase